VSDGGTLSSGDIADTTGRHVDSVRRALDRLGDMVEKSTAVFRFDLTTLPI